MEVAGFREFVELVRQVRHNQRRYMVSRRPEILETCRELESRLDAVISELTDRQMRLFD